MLAFKLSLPFRVTAQLQKYGEVFIWDIPKPPLKDARESALVGWGFWLAHAERD